MQVTKDGTILPEPLIKNAVVQWTAKVISVLFHPLFVPVYCLWLLFYTIDHFPGLSVASKGMLMIRFFIHYTFFPLVTILVAKGVGFVESIYLRSRQDRIIPYVACGMFYFWMWYTLRNQPEVPKALVTFAMGVFVSSSLGLVLNAFTKLSMHGISMGVAAALFFWLSMQSDRHLGFFVSMVVLATGLVGTARLVNGDHTPAEVWGGIGIGVLGFAIAVAFN